MKDEIISIIIPLFNVEQYVLGCLRSITEQTLSDGVECILVDDCGNDRSVEIVQTFIEQYHGPISFRLVHHDCNRGLSAARNTGILQSSGKYLFFLDSDDKLYDSKSLERLWYQTVLYPEVDMVQGNFFIEEIGNVTFEETVFPSFTKNTKWIRAKITTLQIPESACNRLIRRNIIIDNKLFFKEGWIQEDTLWTYRLHNYIHSIAFCFVPSYFYAYNSESIMHSSGREKEGLAFVKIINEVYFLLQSQPIHVYDIRFLELLAMRSEKSMGKKAYLMMSPYRNNLFRFLFRINSSTYNSEMMLYRLAGKVISSFLRFILLNKLIFNINNDSI